MIPRGARRTIAIVAALGWLAIVAPVFADTVPRADGGTIRLLYNIPGTNSFPPYVIQKYALDKKHGFTLEAIPTANTQSAVIAMQSGGAEIALFGWNDIARIRSAGVKIVGIAPFLAFGVDFIVVPTDSPIKDFGDLKGKKIGVSGITAINTIAMAALAKSKYHFDLAKDATLQAGAPALLQGLLEQGQVDASGIFNSVAPSMVATGKFRILTNIKGITEQLGLPDTPYLLYVADTDYAAAHPDNVKAFVAAYRDSVQVLETDDAPWLDHGKELQMSPEVVALFSAEARADLRTTFAPNTEADIRKTFDLLLATAGAEAMGMSALPSGFMTLDYQ